MTETEWRSSKQLPRLIEFVRNRKLSRKLRLFGCALCRRFGELLTRGPVLQAVETAERYADRQATRTELARARAAVKVIQPRTAVGWVSNAASFICAASPDKAAFWAYSATHEAARLFSGKSFRDPTNSYPEESAHLLRHIVGDPFRRVVIDRALLRWNDGAIPALAWAAYEERSFPEGRLDAVRLNVLADALEEAGCENLTLVDHLREIGPHVRGCWVIDLLIRSK